MTKPDELRELTDETRLNAAQAQKTALREQAAIRVETTDAILGALGAGWGAPKGRGHCGGAARPRFRHSGERDGPARGHALGRGSRPNGGGEPGRARPGTRARCGRARYGWNGHEGWRGGRDSPRSPRSRSSPAWRSRLRLRGPWRMRGGGAMRRRFERSPRSRVLLRAMPSAVTASPRVSARALGGTAWSVPSRRDTVDGPTPSATSRARGPPARTCFTAPCRAYPAATPTGGPGRLAHDSGRTGADRMGANRIGAARFKAARGRHRLG